MKGDYYDSLDRSTSGECNASGIEKMPKDANGSRDCISVWYISFCERVRVSRDKGRGAPITGDRGNWTTDNAGLTGRDER